MSLFSWNGEAFFFFKKCVFEVDSLHRCFNDRGIEESKDEENSFKSVENSGHEVGSHQAKLLVHKETFVLLQD